MIPKILHHCWFGGKEKPQEVMDYIETWKQFLPDYELKEWNETNYDYKSCKFTREAYAMKKYAYVSDVCRLQALYNYGGLYLDTDVEVVGSFKPFEELKSFIGYEVDDLVGTGIIGAEKHAEWIKIFLQEYADRDFIHKDGTLNLVPNTVMLTRLLSSIPETLRPTIFPLETFCAMHWKTHEVIRNESTVSIHHYRASWNSDKVTWMEYKERGLCRRLHLPSFHILTRLYKVLLRFK